MDHLHVILYATALACFLLALKDLSRPGTERRGIVNMLTGGSIVAGLVVDLYVAVPISAVMAGIMGLLAFVLVVFSTVDRRLSGLRQKGALE